MRNKWNHVEPEGVQDVPEDNTSYYVAQQVRTWEFDHGALINPEIAMQIASYWHGPADDALTAFSHRGEVRNNLVEEVETAIKLAEARPLPSLEDACEVKAMVAELRALLAYVRAVKG